MLLKLGRFSFVGRFCFAEINLVFVFKTSKCMFTKAHYKSYAVAASFMS
jgi:hypothetical protein